MHLIVNNSSVHILFISLFQTFLLRNVESKLDLPFKMTFSVVMNAEHMQFFSLLIRLHALTLK